MKGELLTPRTAERPQIQVRSRGAAHFCTQLMMLTDE